MKIKFASLTIILSALMLSGCTVPAPTENTQSQQEEVSNSSFIELFERGDSIVCTWSQDTEGQKTSGTTYMSNGKFYQEVTFDSELENVVIDGTLAMIGDGEWVYMWNLDNPEEGGTKLSFDETVNSEESTEAGDSFNFEEQMEFNCNPWSVDESKFTPPNNVQFTELDNLFENLDDDFLSGACEICSNMPTEEEINDCRIQLGCE